MRTKKTFSRKLARLGVLGVCLLFLFGTALVTDAGAEDAVVLVNSMSADYDDFQHYIKPYLDNFGVSYATLDISSEPVGAAIGDYNLIIVGHRQLDPDDAYLDPTEETNITLAVNAGTGLLNFDNDLSGDGATPRYQFIDDIFGFSYTSPPSASGVTFTSEGYTGIRINCWEDDHQNPVLVTTSDVPTLTANSQNAQWTEFLYTQTRPYPSVMASALYTAGLPTMHFYADAIPNGQYEVFANLYDNAAMRYYYGYSETDPGANFITTSGGATGGQHREYSLGIIDITDNSFDLYVNNAQLINPADYDIFGWAWINLVPAQETLINCWEDDHQDPVLATTEIPADIVEDDGAWTEFLYTSTRPYPTILAGVDEEDNGLPLMRFYASGIPSGEYEVFANLYDNAAIRYFYGYTETDPKANFVNTAGGASGDQHEEYSLGTVTITDGNFNIYVQDADLISGSYAFFGWAWIRLVETGSSPPPSVMHYVTERHDPGDVISTGTMTLAGITTPETVSNLAMTGSQPFLAVTTSSSGNAVQFGTYNWMSHAVKGPIYGLDDLVWRSIVWAARKPFVMQGVPPFVTMRVDDESGPFWWIDIANEFGIKPWAGLFFHNIDDAEAAHLSSLVNAGLATTSIHAFNGGFFYFNHSGSDWPDATIAAYYEEGTQWHLDHNIPISKFMLPHYYEIGTNAFQGLSDWGVEFIGTQMEPGNGYGAPWIINGPYRNYETGGSSEGRPGYYADFITVPGHPEFDGQFFNCVTEIRDDAGYEWYPSSDVAGTVGRGTRQTKRALDSMALATLFTHGYFMNGIGPESWRSILEGITTNLEPYNPIYVTLDHACQYIRAMHTSDILASSYDPALRLITVTLTGATDMPTMFYLFTEEGGNIQETLVDVPTFSGSTDVVYQMAGPLDHIIVTPSTTTVAIGGSQQFTAQGYDADDNPIPNLPFTWDVVSGGGTINSSGLFTAGMVDGIYSDTIIASYSGIEGYASVEVVEPTLDHFTFDFVYSPQYIDIPFVVTITARDISGNPMIGYTGQTSLTDSTGTMTPTLTANFVGGEWTGEVVVGQLSSDVTITASDGLATGISNIFYVEDIPGYYDVTSPSYTQTESIPFPVTVTENAIRINCWEDDHQDPVLYTFYDPTQFVPDDNLWDEFKYNLRDYPGVFASQTENPEMMSFYGAVPNGSYRVIANLYRTNDFRYYYGFDPATPRESFVDVTTGPIGDFAEFDLGTVTITDNMFSLYTDHADVITDRGAFPYYGWAWIRLVPAQTEYQINCWVDDHQDPILATTESIPALVDNDGLWTEFLYTPSRPYPSILAGDNEENYGLPVMRFYTSGISNGEYQVIANLYTSSPGRDMRYFYGYTPGDPKANFVDTIGGSGGTEEHTEYSLGTVNITDGTFNIYVQDAELTGTGYNFFGWAWIRLVPVSGDVQINCGEDDQQDPVLVTSTSVSDLVETDGLWTEFLYTPLRPYPSILAGADEEDYGLPVMRFYESGIPNGEYEVIANLYTNVAGRDMRYFYGYTPGDPKANFVDTIGGSGLTEQHTEYSLGTVTITDGSFNIYVQDADLTGTGYNFFGWAWVRLVSTNDQNMITMNSSSSTMLFDGDEDGIFGEPGDNVKPLINGALNIMALDTTPDTDVEIIATDAFGLFGSTMYTIEAIPEELIIDGISPVEYETGIVELPPNKAEIYIDRGYGFLIAPTDYVGLPFIRTASNDKRNDDEEFLSFQVNQPVTVYVCYSVNAASPPDWLENNFTMNSDQIIVDYHTHNVWEKNFLPGEIVLGGNLAPGAVAGDGVIGMYFVIIEGYSEQPYTLNMQVSPPATGTTEPPAGMHTYYQGDVVNITALPNPGYIFDSWTGNVDDPLSPTTTVTINTNSVVTANFLPVPTYSLTMEVSPGGAGTTDPPAGANTYNQDDLVTITATPAVGYIFDSWTGDVDDTLSPTTTVTMYDNLTVTANFLAVPTATLTMDISPGGSGTTDPPLGANDYNQDDLVTITAIPAPGYLFDSWTGDVDDPLSPTTTVTMYDNLTVTANFLAVPTYTLTMEVSPGGAGTTDPPVGINTYNQDDLVTITAIPAAGYIFDSWTGDVDDPSSPITTVTLYDNLTVTANFLLAPEELQITITTPADYETGIVSLPPNKAEIYIDRGYGFLTAPAYYVGLPFIRTASNDKWNDDEEFLSFQANKLVTVYVCYSANAATGPDWLENNFTMNGDQITVDYHTHDVWEGDYLPGEIFLGGNLASGVVAGDGVIGMYFVIIAESPGEAYTLDMQIAPPSAGTTDPTAGMHPYYQDDVVTITATPAAGYIFDSWTGDVDDPLSPTTTVTMYDNLTVTANFQAVPTVTLTMDVSPAGAGTTDPPDGVNTYYQDDLVTINASPAAGYLFDSWTGDVDDPLSPTTTVTLYDNLTVTANFLAVPTVTLTMDVSPAGAGTTDPPLGVNTYNQDDLVSITATPSVGYIFDSWTGDVDDSLSPTTTVTLYDNLTVTANCLLAPEELQITITTPADYETGIVSLPPNKAEIYIDRGYGFLTAPAYYVGLPFIRTASNDKWNTAEEFLTFQVNKPVTVYVCYSVNAATGPDWLENNFLMNGDQITVDYHTHNLWQAEYPAGEIILGGNRASGTVVGDGVIGMYFVIIEEQ